MTSVAEKIRTAPNAKVANAILESGEAIVNRGRGVWAYTVNGSIWAEGSFAEARSAAARFNEE